MALARKLQTRRREASPHKTWRDPGGSTVVACIAANEPQLLHLAREADRIVVREAPGPGVDPRSAAQIAKALGAVKLLTSGEIQNPEMVLKRLRIVLGDRLARTRIVDGRHVLAGLFDHETEDGFEAVLLLVLANRHVSTCEWHLAPDA